MRLNYAKDYLCKGSNPLKEIVSLTKSKNTSVIDKIAKCLKVCIF
jgi:hypothetical protein